MRSSEGMSVLQGAETTMVERSETDRSTIVGWN